MAGILYGIGVGPGDPELITVKAIKTINLCQVVALPQTGSGNVLAYEIAKQQVPALAKKERLELLTPMTRDKVKLDACHDQAAETIIKQLQQGKNVAFLTLGDPAIYSTYLYIHKRVLAKGQQAQIIPGVPSFCAVAAKLNIGLSEQAEPLHIIPASYDESYQEFDWKGTKVLMKTGKSMSKVKEVLMEKGMYEQAKMVQRCGLEGEAVYQSLDEADDAASYFSVIIVKESKKENKNDNSNG